MAKNHTTIIIPIFNEAFLLRREIPAFLTWVSEQSGYEVLLVENGSTDTSPKMVDKLAARFASFVRPIHLPTAAIGGAVRNGALQVASPSIVLLSADWLDRDFVHNASSMLQTTSVDVVLGSKGMAQSRDERPWPRRLLSSILIMALHLLFGYRGKTINGVQAFRTATVQPLVRQCRSSEIIESELVLRAARAGLKIQEVPVVLSEQRPARVGIIRRGFKVLGELMQLRRVLRHNNLHVKIHIDDAGHDDVSLTALKQLVDVGRVESASVMANMPATKAFAEFWHSLPAAKRPALFLHFNLVENKPITSMPAITKPDGHFAGMPRTVGAALNGKLTLDDVRRELDAQLAELEARGLKIEGIDSHMHMHCLAPAAVAVEDVAKKRGFMVRDFRNFCAVTLRGKVKLWLLGIIARATQLRLDGHWHRPISWRSKKDWQPFVMCSWEGVSTHNVPDHAIIACHPRIGCDVYEIE